MRFFSFLFLSLLSYGLFGQSGCYTTGNMPVNIDNGERYSWSLNLYKPSHIGSVGALNSLRLYVTAAGSGASATLTGIKIYMRHTGTASYASAMGYPGTTGFTQVFDGNIPASSVGSVDLSLNGNFVHNGVNNVEILFVNDQNKSYSNISFARTTLATGGPMIGAERGASSWATVSGASGATRRSYVLRINNMTCSESWTAGGVLPVKLAAFSARLVESIARLSWQTTSEENADFFEIERSRDARDFVKIGQVSAKGRLEALTEYGFDDELTAMESRAYYRLKSVDKDGSFDYSPIRVVTFAVNRKEGDGAVYPNPANSQQVTIDLGAGVWRNPDLIVRDNSGRIVPVSIRKTGQGKWEINTKNFASGIYFVEALADGKSIRRKLVVN